MPEAAAPAPEAEAILVVEDEGGIREILREVLESAGYRVLVASSETAALALSDSDPRRLDLLLSDVELPGGGGPDLWRRLRVRRPDLRVLFISGYSELPDTARVPPGTPLLTKPFPISRLLETVRRALAA